MNMRLFLLSFIFLFAGNATMEAKRYRKHHRGSHRRHSGYRPYRRYHRRPYYNDPYYYDDDAALAGNILGAFSDLTYAASRPKTRYVEYKDVDDNNDDED